MPRITSRLRVVAAAALAFALTGGPAFAENVGRWECHTGYGENDRIIVPEGRAISGHIQFVDGVIGPDRMPRAEIALRVEVPPGEGGCGCTGLLAFLVPKPEGGLKVQFEVHGNGNAEPFAQAKPGVPITFRVAVKDGVLTISMGKTDPVTKTLRLRYPPAGPLNVSCSGANVVFSDLELE